MQLHCFFGICNNEVLHFSKHTIKYLSNSIHRMPVSIFIGYIKVCFVDCLDSGVASFILMLMHSELNGFNYTQCKCMCQNLGHSFYIQLFSKYINHNGKITPTNFSQLNFYFRYSFHRVGRCSVSE